MSGSKTTKSEEQVEKSRSPSPTKKTVIESRRAEQNRAAQRAFRQRKELYVKELEAKVNAMANWPARMDQLEEENESLKRKISELLGKGGEEKSNSNKKLFVTDPTPSKSNSTSSSSSTSSNCKKNTDCKLTRAKTTSPQPSTTSPPLGKAVVGEKGKVLDDLVSILRTRNRPPIPSHPQTN
ncbi:unnamed protein product [Mucor hiemalis]